MQFRHPSCLGPLNFDGHLLPSSDRFADMWINFEQHIRDPATQVCGVFLFFLFFSLIQWMNFTPASPQYSRKRHSPDETRVWRVPGESWACSRPVFHLDWIHPPSGCDDTHMWCLCGAGRFSYGVPPRTPPLEGTSLHRRNKSVERPWGILSLFTTCFPLQVNSPCQKV